MGEIPSPIACPPRRSLARFRGTRIPPGFSSRFRRVYSRTGTYRPEFHPGVRRCNRRCPSGTRRVVCHRARWVRFPRHDHYQPRGYPRFPRSRGKETRVEMRLRLRLPEPRVIRSRSTPDCVVVCTRDTPRVSFRSSSKAVHPAHPVPLASFSSSRESGNKTPCPPGGSPRPQTESGRAENSRFPGEQFRGCYRSPISVTHCPAHSRASCLHVPPKARRRRDARCRRAVRKSRGTFLVVSRNRDRARAVARDRPEMFSWLLRGFPTQLREAAAHLRQDREVVREVTAAGAFLGSTCDAHSDFAT